jgi:hypothetical protein
MNSASVAGRLAPGFLAHRLGILNLIMGAMGCGAVFILSMIALRTIASVVVIGVLYGLCVGVCAYLTALCLSSFLVSFPLPSFPPSFLFL